MWCGAGDPQLNPNHRTLNKVDPEILAFATAERVGSMVGKCLAVNSDFSLAFFCWPASSVF